MAELRSSTSTSAQVATTAVEAAPKAPAKPGLIGWPTVVFQIVNFLILVWLLKRFLYGRILKAMDERQARIASQLQEAEETKNAAGQEAEALRKKNEEFDAQRQDMLAKAKGEVEAQRKEMLAKARAEIDALHARWREAVEREKAAFLADLRQRVSRQTCAIARRALADMASADLEGRLIDAFLGRLNELPDAQRQALAPLPEQDRRMSVRSEFEIPEERRQQIREALRTHIADGLDLQFETSPEVICGIELVGGGRKLAWSLDNYLDKLEEDLREAFEEQPPEEVLRQEVERDVRKDEEEQAEEKQSEEPKEEEASVKKEEQEQEKEEEKKDE